jgi:hypothetical protein
MKKLLVLLALVVVAAIPSFAQATFLQDGNLQYLVDYFSNNAGPGGAADQQLRLVNFGALGTPLTSPIGDVCANIYVFDANQEMVECCSCRITPNGLRTISVANDLTNNPLTSVVPVNGAIKIITTQDGVCSAVIGGTAIGLDSLVGFGTHLQTSGGTAQGTSFTETKIPAAQLSYDEEEFLYQACQFVRSLGSGKGVCSCGS